MEWSTTIYWDSAEVSVELLKFCDFTRRSSMFPLSSCMYYTAAVIIIHCCQTQVPAMHQCDTIWNALCWVILILWLFMVPLSWCSAGQHSLFRQNGYMVCLSQPSSNTLLFSRFSWPTYSLDRQYSWSIFKYISTKRINDSWRKAPRPPKMMLLPATNLQRSLYRRCPLWAMKWAPRMENPRIRQ